jgi:hypothetical protein
MLYFESWVKFMGFIFLTSQTMGVSKTRYVHGTHCPKFLINLYKASLAHPS